MGKLNQLYDDKKNLTLAGIALGLLFPIVGWIIGFIKLEIPVSFQGFAQMHYQNPVIYLVYFIPVLIGSGIFYFLQKREHEQEGFVKQLADKNTRIDLNAEFAKEIGKGNFQATLTIGDQEDILGKSLLLMRDNLLANSRKEAEQSWIAEGKELISTILRMHTRLEDLSYDVIVSLIRYIKVIQGALYIYDENTQKLTNLATYAYNRKKYFNQEFLIGQGLVGQCAYEMDIIYRTEIPDDFATVTSGILGDKKPSCLLLIPLFRTRSCKA